LESKGLRPFLKLQNDLYLDYKIYTYMLDKEKYSGMIITLILSIEGKMNIETESREVLMVEMNP
jgi:hypothetical protein